MVRCLEAVFDPAAEAAYPVLRTAWIAGLYVAGAAAWAYLLGWGRVPLDFHDWGDINVPRLLFVGTAISSGRWPLHMLNTHSLHDVTDRFLSLPDVVTTPQMLLLPLLGVQRFILFDVLLHYSAGAAGLLALRRRFGWSLFTYAVVSVLFLFNGHILAHYSMGHFTWASYFLFPFVVMLTFDLVDGHAGWAWVARFAFLMFYMVLAGGQHQFTWVMMFLACLLPFCWARARWIVAAIAASGLLSAVRLLPPALSLGAFGQEGWMSDVIGYPSVLHLLRALIDLRREDLGATHAPLAGNFIFFESNYFEYTYFVGVIGAAVIVYFGVWAWLRDREPMYPQVILPTFAVMACSIATVFRIVRATGVPMIMSERITSRMLSLPMTVLIILAGVTLQRFVARASFWNRVTALALFVLLAVDLSGGVRVWRVTETLRTTHPIALDGTVGQLAYRDDAPYIRALTGGAALTLLTAGGLVVMARRERMVVAS